jgi:hypothetical protein
MTLDSQSYDLVGKSIASGGIWDGIVDVPLQGQREIFEALGQASRLELNIENADRAWIMPTRGLSDAIDALKSSCEAHRM